MTIKDNCSLLEHNTFGIDVKASHFVDYDSVDELQAFVRQHRDAGDTTPLLHIGGGSNLLFLRDFDGTILHSHMREIHVTANEGDFVYVRVSAGITWDDWVQYAVDSHWYGLENLSLIPGEVGASAVQNIGAYGSEAKDFILFVDTVDLQTGEIRHFTAEECRYGYRDSAFKHELKGKYIVTSVVYRVKPGDATKTREEIIQTRMAKLPAVGEIGSAGSFFMNPFVPEQQANELLKLYPDMPHFPSPQGVKIPAAWLIEQCGWKGKTLGGAQVWPKQPLVIVNAGNATPDDIIALAAQVSASVKEKFNIDIRPEVNYI